MGQLVLAHLSPTSHFNSLCRSNAKWWHRSGSTWLSINKTQDRFKPFQFQRRCIISLYALSQNTLAWWPHLALEILAITGSGNDLLTIWCRAITWTNADLSSTGPSETLSMTFHSQFNLFHLRRCIWNCYDIYNMKAILFRPHSCWGQVVHN